MTDKIDARIVHGARCTWWDNIQKVALSEPGRSGHRLPCCPHCHGMLFETPNEQEWFAMVDRYEQAGHPGYRKMVEWARGKCFPNMTAMQAVYLHEMKCSTRRG